ncbi:class I SAM-dependent methyltransferase [Marinicella litoralis]|uniref:Methyltransferase family protein n=1 Tax=Marinicella litoralis TaxID=644220 RepID=A0A4R6XTE7_9GAMM|nr:class I SAM-dependent methyltransferase [Marinicella litoralis]TDR23232.1 methyltransferase family protein [Marinicella litoralis]
MTEKNIDYNKQYWNEFYKNNHKLTPSQFCVSVLTELADQTCLVELGSGNGRDSFYFSSQGFVTVAMDLSKQAIESCKQQATQRKIKHASFYQGDLTSSSDVGHVIAKARTDKKEGGDMAFYSRFVMHSLDDEQEQAFLGILSEQVLSGEKVYFEFRSKEDENLDKHFGNHYRRYVDTAVFKQRLDAAGFELEYEVIGQGMAKYKEEDPFVARFIARKVNN